MWQHHETPSFSALFDYVQKLKSDFKSWFECLIWEKNDKNGWSKNHRPEEGCLISTSITHRHLREDAHASPGPKCDTVPCFSDWLALDKERRGGQPGGDSTAPQGFPWSSEHPTHFFLMEEFPDDMKMPMSSQSKFVSMWLLPWCKLLVFVYVLLLKILSNKEPPPLNTNPCHSLTLLPPVSVGWIIQWLPKFVENEIKI